MRRTTVLLLLSCLLVSTLQLDASSIPCNNQIFYESTYTAAVTYTATNVTDWTEATLSISGQTYDTFSGKWVHAATN